MQFDRIATYLEEIYPNLRCRTHAARKRARSHLPASRRLRHKRHVHAVPSDWRTFRQRRRHSHDFQDSSHRVPAEPQALTALWQEWLCLLSASRWRIARSCGLSLSRLSCRPPRRFPIPDFAMSPALGASKRTNMRQRCYPSFAASRKRREMIPVAR